MGRENISVLGNLKDRRPARQALEALAKETKVLDQAITVFTRVVGEEFPEGGRITGIGFVPISNYGLEESALPTFVKSMLIEEVQREPGFQLAVFTYVGPGRKDIQLAVVDQNFSYESSVIVRSTDKHGIHIHVDSVHQSEFPLPVEIAADSLRTEFNVGPTFEQDQRHLVAAKQIFDFAVARVRAHAHL